MSAILSLFIVSFFYSLHFASFADYLTDPNGYIIYCPCMGRFGNQAEQLLGSLHFARSLNRTLVLPPFIEYQDYKILFPSFDTYFKVEPIERFHRVITIENFLKQIASTIWPEEKRVIMCYSVRDGSSQNDCNPFDGNPFKPFWFHLNITRFNSSLFHGPLLTQSSEAKQWIQEFRDHKVLAFVGAPSSFPANQESLPIQKYIQFSQNIDHQAKLYRKSRGFSNTPYLGIHLRRGSDWVRACDLLKENQMEQLFSSHQCTHTLPKRMQPLPYEICYSSNEAIISQIKQVLKESNGLIKTIYFATDFDDITFWRELCSNLPNMTLITPSSTYPETSNVKYKQPHYILDLYLLTYSDYFIGNCISSFSAFVSRSRIALGLNQKTQFFSMDLLNNDYKVGQREEL